MQVKFETDKGQGLFVKVPEGGESFNMSDYDDEALLFYEKSNNDFISEVKIPKDYSIIGLTTDITEDQAKNIVWDISIHKILYKGHNMYFTSAISAFKSLMQSLQVYEVNPYSKFINPEDFNEEDILECKDIQARTGKWIVLFKSK